MVACLELLNRNARAIQGNIKEDLGECIRQLFTHLRRKFVPCSCAPGASRVWERFFIDFRNFRSVVALSYLVRQLEQAIAGHLKEDLGECIRQIHTHLRRVCPGLRSFVVLQLRKVFFCKTKF